jgi:hypothetical protein
VVNTNGGRLYATARACGGGRFFVCVMNVPAQWSMRTALQWRIGKCSRCPMNVTKRMPFCSCTMSRFLPPTTHPTPSIHKAHHPHLVALGFLHQLVNTRAQPRCEGLEGRLCQFRTLRHEVQYRVVVMVVAAVVVVVVVVAVVVAVVVVVRQGGHRSVVVEEEVVVVAVVFLPVFEGASVRPHARPLLLKANTNDRDITHPVRL